jgi:CysZ protein
LRFVDGVRAFFGGVGFVVGTPRVWGFAVVPILVATVLFVVFAWLAIAAVNAVSGAFFAAPSESVWSAVGVWTVRIVLGLVGIVLAFVVAMSLAQLLSGFALERVSREQELALGGRTWPDQPLVASTLRSLRVTLVGLVAFVPILAVLSIVGLLVPPAAFVTIPLKFVVTGVLAAYDLIDYPLGLRGLGVRARFEFLSANFAAVLGFGTSVALVLMVPGGALLILPFATAGATRMVLAEPAVTGRAGARPAA